MALAACLFLTMIWMTGLGRPAAGQQERSQKQAASAESRRVLGRQDFESRCAGCHGLDGHGGERGPDISTSPAVQQLADQEVFRIVHDGIPAKGMPSFDFLPAREITAIVEYLRSLGRPGNQALTGNPERGRELFFGKAQCSACHMMDGRGGFLASDLTAYDGDRTPGQIREGILNASGFHDVRRRVLAVVTHKGERFSGMVRNEDNFSVQLVGRDGAFHLLMKSEIETMNWSPSPLMPCNYGMRLSSTELDDLVSYVTQSHRSQKPGARSQESEARSRESGARLEGDR